MSPGNPKAHFSFRRGTDAAVRPAAASWKRVFALVTPQPFHAGPASGFADALCCAHIDCGAGFVTSGCLKDFPVTNSATARRSDAERAAVIEIIDPLSSEASTRSGVIVISVARVGALSMAASWHDAQAAR